MSGCRGRNLSATRNPRIRTKTKKFVGPIPIGIVQSVKIKWEDLNDRYKKIETANAKKRAKNATLSGIHPNGGAA